MSPSVIYCTLAVWVVLCLNGKSGLEGLFILCLFFFFPRHARTCCVCSHRPWSEQLWMEINTMDKAIKALFVPFVTTGWGLKQSVFYQCQRCDETWLTQEANGIKAPICQPCSRPDRSNRKNWFIWKSKNVFIHFIFCNSLVASLHNSNWFRAAGLCIKRESVISHSKYVTLSELLGNN